MLFVAVVRIWKSTSSHYPPAPPPAPPSATFSYFMISKTDCKLIETNGSSLTETLLFGNSLFDLKKKHPYPSIDYILSTERFKELLF